MFDMIQSSKPRKQRLYRYTAPMHARQKFLNVHISKELSKKLGIKKRTIELRKGDTVKVMSGSHKGKSGKVNDVNLATNRINIEGIIRKNAKSKELFISIYSSNVYLTDLDTTDKRRLQKIESFKVK